MQMKKIIPYLLPLLFSSCINEWIDDRDPLTFKETTIETTDDLERLVTGAYFILSSDKNALQDNRTARYNMMSENVVLLSDNPYMSDDNYKIYSRQTTENNISAITSVWTIGYKLANSASIPITYVTQHGRPADPQKQLDRILGEAYFLRSFAHFTLIRLFAKPYSTANRTMPGIVIKREAAANGEGQTISTIGEVYDFIIEDLTNALTLLPEKYDATLHPSYYATDARVKRDAARFLLACVYFQMGSDAEINRQKAWALAVPLMNTIIDNTEGISKRTYSLADPDDVWLSYPGQPAPAEIVWEYSNLEWKNQKIVQSFLANKSALTGSSPRDRIFPLSNHLLTDAGWRIPTSSSDTAGIHDKRYLQLYLYLDPATDVTEGTYFQNLEKPYIWANMFAGYANDSSLFKGYRVKDDILQVNSNSKCNIKTPMMRIGELQLLRATIFASGVVPGDPKNDMDKILIRANRTSDIRSAYSLEDVIREHRRETAFEGKRINYLQALRKTIPAGDSPSDNPHLRVTRENLTWDSEKLYWPVPNEEEIRNPNIYE